MVGSEPFLLPQHTDKSYPYSLENIMDMILLAEKHTNGGIMLVDNSLTGEMQIGFSYQLCVCVFHF